MSLYRIKMCLCVATVAIAMASAAQAEAIKITLRQVTADGMGQEVGTVEFRDGQYGLLIVPNLKGLTPGPHGAHIHEKPDCGPAMNHGNVVPGGAAGGHFDPQNTGYHEGPYGNGHLGDLPNLIVEEDGTAFIPVLAPQLKVADIHSRALMIHAGADRYLRHGAHMHGKGGMRMYCGIIP